LGLFPVFFLFWLVVDCHNRSVSDAACHTNSVCGIVAFPCVRHVRIGLAYTESGIKGSTAKMKTGIDEWREGGMMLGMRKIRFGESGTKGEPGLALTYQLSARDRKVCRGWLCTSGYALLRYA